MAETDDPALFDVWTENWLDLGAGRIPSLTAPLSRRLLPVAPRGEFCKQRSYVEVTPQ